MNFITYTIKDILQYSDGIQVPNVFICNVWHVLERISFSFIVTLLKCSSMYMKKIQIILIADLIPVWEMFPMKNRHNLY